MEILASLGFFQYEISNFSRPGMQSRHNLRYWNADPFLGFGPAAYSDFEGVRFGNRADPVSYAEGRIETESSETPDAEARRQEYVMLRMRLSAGVEHAAYAARFGRSLERDFGARLAPYVSMGLVLRREEGYAFTPEGMYVSNRILSDILDL